MTDRLPAAKQPSLLGRIAQRVQSFATAFTPSARPFVLGPGRQLPRRKTPGRPRVAWVLAGGEWLGSARLKGFMMDGLSRRRDVGFDSVLAYYWKRTPNIVMNLSPAWKRKHWLPFLKRADVVVIESWQGNAAELLADCAERGIASILVLSDLIYERIPAAVLSQASAVVTSSEFLRSRGASYHPRVVCIDDPIEVPPGLRRQPSQRGENPELAWIGHGLNWHQVEFLRDVLAADGLRNLPLRTISLHPEATVQWDPHTVWPHLTHSDIAVVPCETSEWGRSKSSNRLTLWLALGYPVVATPIPAYERFITHGENGFFATTPEEWRQCLRELRDPVRRERMSLAAAQTPALASVAPEGIAAQWRSLFLSLT